MFIDNRTALGHIWQHVEHDIKDEKLQNALLHVGYTAPLHVLFAAITLDQAGPDDIKLPWVLKPLIRYYQAREKLTSKELEELKTQNTGVTEKVTLLFKNKANPELSDLLSKQAYDVQSMTNNLNKFQTILSEMEWAMKNPRFKEKEQQHLFWQMR